MKIIAFIQMYNEFVKGNLHRCLKNCTLWADDIVIYDDGSTDDSVQVARQYTDHVILGKENNICKETFHKQQLLEFALTLGPDWLMWLDCDEILDRNGTNGGLRTLCELAPPNIDAYSFHEINLWRSQTFARIDTLFDVGWFVRLWRVKPGIVFETKEGVHLRLYPITIESVERAGIQVIHYGFWDYKKCLEKIGATYSNKETLMRVARDNWILNEEACETYKVPLDWFPEDNVPEDRWSQPQPIRIEDLKCYSEL